jgi:adenylate cyclase class IV
MKHEKMEGNKRHRKCRYKCEQTFFLTYRGKKMKGEKKKRELKLPNQRKRETAFLSREAGNLCSNEVTCGIA